MTPGPDVERLALYGTLRRGEENHWLVRSIAGTWTVGTVSGWTYSIGWGPAEGYPGITLDAAGNRVPVDVLTSDRLDRHWRELDEFEGPGYRRIETEVVLADDDTVTAWIYETVPDAE